MTKRMLALLGICTVLMAACDQFGEKTDTIKLTGSGQIVEETYDFSDFDRVEASHVFDVTITPGEAFMVVVRFDDNVQEYLDVHVNGNALRLTLDSDHGYNFHKVTLEAEITMPELKGVALSGASHADVNGFQSGSRFETNLSGASKLHLDLEAGEARFDLSGSSELTGNASITGAVTVDTSGASEVTLTGSGGDLQVDTSGSSRVNLADFPVGNANANASGNGEITLNLNGTLDIDASGSSTVRYFGDVTPGQIKTSGSAKVTAQQ